MSVPDGTEYDYGMSGNSAQRRKALRAKERLSKRAMSEGRYPWLDNLISQPEASGEPQDAIKPTLEDLSREIPPKAVASSTPKPIAPPEPRGEAEGALAGEELMNWDLVHEVHTEGKQFERIKEKKRPLLWRIWRGMRKLVGR